MKNKYADWSVRFLILAALLLNAAFVSGSELGIQPDKVNLTVGEWQPYISSELKNNGLICDIISTAFKQVGIKVEYRFLHQPAVFGC